MTLDAFSRELTRILVESGVLLESESIGYEHVPVDPNVRKAVYSRIPEIIEANRQLIEASEATVEHRTTGDISEYLCRCGLPPQIYETSQKLGSGWAWVGDLMLPGHPFGVTVSVKSFSAKERLLASGLGSVLAPVIGWGLFKSPDEFSRKRLNDYLYRGFVAIYMPEPTLERALSKMQAEVDTLIAKKHSFQLKADLNREKEQVATTQASRSKSAARVETNKMKVAELDTPIASLHPPKNINGNRLLRPLTDFPLDLANAIVYVETGAGKQAVLDIRKL